MQIKHAKGNPVWKTDMTVTIIWSVWISFHYPSMKEKGKANSFQVPITKNIDTNQFLPLTIFAKNQFQPVSAVALWVPIHRWCLGRVILIFLTKWYADVRATHEPGIPPSQVSRDRKLKIHFRRGHVMCHFTDFFTDFQTIFAEKIQFKVAQTQNHTKFRWTGSDPYLAGNKV